MATKKHSWNFSTVGGVKRVNIEKGSDLLALDQLDQKLWTALSCPVKGLEIDTKTLKLIDSDDDDQINVADILEAVKWISGLIKNPDELLTPDVHFNLDEINTDTEEGKKLLASARIILKNLNLENTNTLCVEQTSDTEKIFAETPFNGDGIITEDSSKDESIKAIINTIINTISSERDRGGKQGVTADIIKEFYKQCQEYSDWLQLSENEDNGILPFGNNTKAAYAAYMEVKNKMDDYFIRCNLSIYDELTTSILNINSAKVEDISTLNLSDCMDQIADFPLAKINSKNILHLKHGINPAWESKIENFCSHVLNPLLGEIDVISQQQWENMVDFFAAYNHWISTKAGIIVESLGIIEVRNILKEYKQTELLRLVDQDMALESEANSIILVDKLVRYHRDIYTLIRNFVTFYDFYSPGRKAIFQNGTLYIDQRSCDLCLTVNDLNKHNLMVSLSGMFLIYCDCRLSGSNEHMTIVAALTNGDIDNLVVGRNALFYDCEGRSWKATVIKIIENPISIRQAFFTPYRKVSRMIETQINKAASAEDQKVTAAAQGHVENASGKMIDEHAEAVKKENQTNKPVPAPTPFDIGKFVGIFAAIGLALGAIGSVLASIFSGFLDLVWWKMPIAILGIILAISGPSMIIAYLKLRKRNLAPLLDANGWAINARAIINIPFGNTLTHLASLPEGAKVNLNDPFTNKKRPFLATLSILIIVAAAVLFLLWKYEFIHIRF